MSVEFEQNKDVLTVNLSGEIDHHTASGIREKIDAKLNIARPLELIIDFSNIGFMDSSGIGLVMGRYKLMKLWGGTVRIANTAPRIQKVMEMAGLSKLVSFENIKKTQGKSHEERLTEKLIEETPKLVLVKKESNVSRKPRSPRTRTSSRVKNKQKKII